MFLFAFSDTHGGRHVVEEGQGPEGPRQRRHMVEAGQGRARNDEDVVEEGQGRARDNEDMWSKRVRGGPVTSKMAGMK